MGMPAPQHRFHLNLRSPEEVRDSAAIVSSFASDPQDVFTGIYELLINAIEHGNLGISFIQKNELMRRGEWQKEINRRLRLRNNSEKSVRVEILSRSGECRFTITDSGNGFNWRQRLSEDCAESRPHGRGLVIAMQSGFESMEFNEAGNAVTCRLRSGV